MAYMSRKRVYAGPVRSYRRSYGAKRRRFSRTNRRGRFTRTKRSYTGTSKSSANGHIWLKRKPFNKKKWLDDKWKASNAMSKMRSYGNTSNVLNANVSGNTVTLTAIRMYPIDFWNTGGGGSQLAGDFAPGSIFIRGGVSKLSFVRAVDAGVDETESPTFHLRVWKCFSKRGFTLNAQLTTFLATTWRNGWDPTVASNPDWHNMFSISKHWEKFMTHEEPFVIEEKISPRSYDLSIAQDVTTSEGINMPFYLVAYRSMQDTVTERSVVFTATHNMSFTGDLIDA